MAQNPKNSDNLSADFRETFVFNSSVICMFRQNVLAAQIMPLHAENKIKMRPELGKKKLENVNGLDKTFLCSDGVAILEYNYAFL